MHLKLYIYCINQIVFAILAESLDGFVLLNIILNSDDVLQLKFKSSVTLLSIKNY